MPHNVDELSPPASCSILTWGHNTAANDGAGRQPAADCRRRPLVTCDDLRDEIASLAARRDGPTRAAAATMSSFVAAAGAERQERQRQEQEQVRRQAPRKPLIILHGLPEPFLSTLLESPLGIDPAFAEAHAEGRRYRPRGAAHRRRRGAGATTPAAAAHWDYPELVAGYRPAVGQQERPLARERPGRARRPAVMPVGGGADEELAAAFCRASLWAGAGGADVLLLDAPVWRRPGGALRRARGRSRASVEGNLVARHFDGGSWPVVPREQGGAIPTLEEVLQETLGAGDVDGTLEEVLEEEAYDHWLEFFEFFTPTPRRKAIILDSLSLEWQVMEALERNTDMRNDIARRRRNPSLGSYPDWECLTRRLRLRVEMFSTMPQLLEVPTAQPREKEVPTAQPRRKEIYMHEDDLVRLPAVRQPVPAGDGGDPYSGANENQRALDRVTYLGGVLLPFSIVSGVLSMNEDFGPGHALFWVFWVAAVPLAVVAILVIYADKLRQAEVWVAVPVEDEDSDASGGSVPEEKGYESKKRGRKRQGLRPEPVPRASMSGGSVHFPQPEAITYSTAGEVVINLGTMTATIEDSAISAEPPPHSSPAPPMPDDDQDQPGQQAGEEVEGVEIHIPEVANLPAAANTPQAVDLGRDDLRYFQHWVRPPPPPGGTQSAPLRIPPITNPIPTVGTTHTMVHRGSYHRRRLMRKQQLGWVGAVLCMLNLRKPSLVSEGEPVGATW